MTEPAPRRHLPLPFLIGLGVVAAAGIGIPVGLATGSRNDPPPSTVTAVTPPAPVARTASPAAGTTEEPASHDAGSGTLTSDQEALRDRMTLDGVLSSTCTGYPPGEQGFAGVVASIECDIADPDMDEPVVYYQFDGADSVASYVRARAADVDVQGDCDRGDESDGYWSAGGVRQGELVCVENVKGDRTLFKLVYSSFRDRTVAVVQDESASDVLAWAETHGRRQFAGT